jgi:hypothetical protein
VDWISLIEALGGGLPAAVIAGLAFAWWQERRRVNELHDARIEDQRDHLSMILENVRTLDAAIRALEGRR